MQKLAKALDGLYSLESAAIDYYGSIHQEVKQQRRACFALANEISAVERHIDVLMQQLIRKVQDLEVQLADLVDNPPAQDQ